MLLSFLRRYNHLQLDTSATQQLSIMVHSPFTLKPLHDQSAPLCGILKTISGSFDKFFLRLSIGSTYTFGREGCDVVLTNPYTSELSLLSLLSSPLSYCLGRARVSVDIRTKPDGGWQASIKDMGSVYPTSVSSPFILQLGGLCC